MVQTLPLISNEPLGWNFKAFWKEMKSRINRILFEKWIYLSNGIQFADKISETSWKYHVKKGYIYFLVRACTRKEQFDA